MEKKLHEWPYKFHNRNDIRYVYKSSQVIVSF